MSGKNLEVSVLLDYYGKLLTEKQLDVTELYYNEDLSLGEISELEDISRQGVRDSIKRAEAFLFELEDKLGMVKKLSALSNSLEQISGFASDALGGGSGDVREYLSKIKEISDEAQKII